MSAIIGYWGYGAHQELEALLTGILAAARPAGEDSRRLSSIPSASSSICSGIACWGRQSRLQASLEASGLLASISASGIPSSADGWIEAHESSLILGRDPFGRVPLYWTRVDRAVWFASRLQLLLPLLEKPRVDPAGLYGYGCFSYVPAPHTPVEKIATLPAGAELVWQVEALDPSNSLSSPLLRRRYEWKEAKSGICNEDEAIAQLQRLLKEAIDEQLADLPSGPVSVSLSGGLDSSIAAALLVRAGVEVRAYTLDFGEYGLSELPFAERVAQHLKIPLVKVEVTPRRVRETLVAAAEALDLPFGDGVTLPLYLLNEAAGRDTTVIFNGEGGDQLFAGWTNKPLLASSIYQDHHPEGGDFNREYLRTFHRLHGYEAAVYTPGLLTGVAALDPIDWLKDALESPFCSSFLHRLRRANLMLKGAQNIQPRATSLAFAHGLSVRTPFTFPRLAEWTFQLAGELCLRGPCEKYLLKKAVEDWLPSEIVWREKRGMGVPLTAWSLGPLWREVGVWLKPDVLLAEGRWQSDLAFRVASGLLSGHIQGRRIGEIIWLLLMWQVWRKAVLKEEFKRSIYNPFWLPSWWWQWRLQRQEI
jgi:asparagine synthase (glutamine-hydrolysing)